MLVRSINVAFLGVPPGWRADPHQSVSGREERKGVPSDRADTMELPMQPAAAAGLYTVQGAAAL